jgi:hypothetical protein
MDNVESPINSNPVTSQNTPQTDKNSGNNWKYFLIGALVSICLLVFGFGGYYFGKMTSSKQSNLTTNNVNLPTPINNPTIIKPTNKEENKTPVYQWIYIKDNSNIYSYSNITNKEEQLTNDASKLIFYRQPKIIDKNTYSFVRCVRQDEEGKKEYECALIKKTINNNEEIIIKRKSTPNVNGYQLGAEINQYQWNNKNTAILYSVENFEKNPSFGILEFHYFNISNNLDNVFLSFKLGGGRGGSLNDDDLICFNLDDSKVVINDTGLYPSASQFEDRGTLFVYDVNKKTIAYEKAKTQSSFGRWLDNNRFIVKQTENDNQTLNIVNLVTSKTEEIFKMDEGYSFEPLDQNIAVFYVINPQPKKGVILKSINLSTKVVTDVKTDWLPLKKLDENILAVKTMVPCDDSPDATQEKMCGMNMFNNVIQDGFGIYNIANGDFIATPLKTSMTSSINDVDVKKIE